MLKTSNLFLLAMVATVAADVYAGSTSCTVGETTLPTGQVGLPSGGIPGAPVDPRFLCWNGQFLGCGWEASGTNSGWATAVTDASTETTDNMVFTCHATATNGSYWTTSTSGSAFQILTPLENSAQTGFVTFTGACDVGAQVEITSPFQSVTATLSQNSGSSGGCSWTATMQNAPPNPAAGTTPNAVNPPITFLITEMTAAEDLIASASRTVNPICLQITADAAITSTEVNGGSSAGFTLTNTCQNATRLTAIYATAQPAGGATGDYAHPYSLGDAITAAQSLQAQGSVPGVAVVLLTSGGAFSQLDTITLMPQTAATGIVPLAILSLNPTSVNQAEISGAASFKQGQGGTWSAKTVTNLFGIAHPLKIFTFDDNFINPILARKTNPNQPLVTELFVNGIRKPRARFPQVAIPNAVSEIINSCTQATVAVGPTSVAPQSALNALVARINKKPGIEAVYYSSYTMTRRPVLSGEITAHGIDLSALHSYGSFCAANPTPATIGGLTGYFENDVGFVSEPGNWYLDETASPVTLYYFPAEGEEVTNETFNIPVADTIFELRGSLTAAQNPNAPGSYRDLSYWLISGVSFEYTGWHYHNFYDTLTHYFYPQGAGCLMGTIDGNYVDHVMIQYSNFLHLGADGINLGGNRDQNSLWGGTSSTPGYENSVSLNTVLYRNQFQDVGGSSVRLDSINQGGSASVDYRNHIGANSVDAPGRNFFDAPGIMIQETSGTTLAGNTVYNTPYSGIAFGLGPRWNSGDLNLIEGNTVEQSMTKLTDGGGIYISTPNGELMTNLVSATAAVRSPDAIPRAPAPGTDLYLDDYTAWWAVYKNYGATPQRPVGVVWHKSRTVSFPNSASFAEASFYVPARGPGGFWGWALPPGKSPTNTPKKGGYCNVISPGYDVPTPANDGAQVDLTRGCSWPFEGDTVGNTLQERDSTQPGASGASMPTWWNARTMPVVVNLNPAGVPQGSYGIYVPGDSAVDKR